MLALATDDPTLRQAAREDGQPLLRLGAVGYSRLAFRRDAIDACRRLEGAERPTRCAEGDCTGSEPHRPRSCLAARGCGRSDAEALVPGLERFARGEAARSPGRGSVPGTVPWSGHKVIAIDCKNRGWTGFP